MFWVACGRFTWFRQCSQFPKMLKDVVSIMATDWRLWHSGCHSHLCPRQSISTQHTWKAQCRDTSKGWYNHHQHHCRVSYSGKLGIPTSARNKTTYKSLDVWSVAETVSMATWVAAEGSINTAGSTIVRIRVSWWQFLKGKYHWSLSRRWMIVYVCKMPAVVEGFKKIRVVFFKKNDWINDCICHQKCEIILSQISLMKLVFSVNPETTAG